MTLILIDHVELKDLTSVKNLKEFHNSWRWVAAFAAASIFTFPWMPRWLGIQVKVKWSLWWWRRCKERYECGWRLGVLTICCWWLWVRRERVRADQEELRTWEEKIFECWKFSIIRLGKVNKKRVWVLFAFSYEAEIILWERERFRRDDGSD